MSRKMFAEVWIDEGIAEKKAAELGMDYAPAEWVESESCWLDESGIFVGQLISPNEGESGDWDGYIKYLISWAFQHATRGDKPENPLLYTEYNNIYGAESNEIIKDLVEKVRAWQGKSSPVTMYKKLHKDMSKQRN